MAAQFDSAAIAKLGRFAPVLKIASAVFEVGAKLPYHRAMVSVQRYLAEQVVSDLARKMVFVAGPRQVGKT
ncbi:MAG: hypothetical protein F4229_11955, partial [Gammaproteobacteria bacterium]|nr:hypothetical protein [Gammaproteobacteria bacterium]